MNKGAAPLVAAISRTASMSFRLGVGKAVFRSLDAFFIIFAEAGNVLLRMTSQSDKFEG